jgi:hypothetical protein
VKGITIQPRPESGELNVENRMCGCLCLLFVLFTCTQPRSGMGLGDNNKPDTKIVTGLTSLVDELGKQKVQHDSSRIPGTSLLPLCHLRVLQGCVAEDWSRL